VALMKGHHGKQTTTTCRLVLQHLPTIWLAFCIYNASETNETTNEGNVRKGGDSQARDSSLDEMRHRVLIKGAARLRHAEVVIYCLLVSVSQHSELHSRALASSLWLALRQPL
jgi:hypothetical protein